MLTGLFQLGYVTNDFDRAVAHFQDKYSIKSFREIMSAGSTRIALAYVGDTMFELIEGVEGAQPLFVDWVKDAGDFVIRHHHLGMRVESRAAMATARARAIDIGHGVVSEGEVEDFVGYLYVDATKTLGHYLEYIRPDKGLQGVFDSVPRY